VALALLLVLLMTLVPLVASASEPLITKADARAAAQRLIEQVSAETAGNPGCPGGVPSWAGAGTGEPLLLYNMTGKPLEYIVPVIDHSARTISTIGVSATKGTWDWYSPKYNLSAFPVVTPAQAVASAKRTLSAGDASGPVGQPQLRIAPDKKMYWYTPVSSGSFTGMWLPAFEKGRVVSNLDTAPWKEASAAAAPAITQQLAPAGTGPLNEPAPSRDIQAVPTQYDITNVPYHSQQTSWWCGPAALEMLFNYWCPDIDQTEIAGVSDAASSYGVYEEELARASQFSSMSSSVQDHSLRGYTARPVGYGLAAASWGTGSARYAYRYSDIKSLVSQDYPVLVLTGYMDSTDSGHFRLIKGYDDTTGAIIFHDPWYQGPGPNGPDQVMSQSFFVDNLWTYSNRWGMIAAPWSVAITKPASVTAGQQFDVSAQVYYRGPVPFNNQYVAKNSYAQLQMPASYQLVTGSITAQLPTVTASGSSGTVKWTVKASKSTSTSDIQVSAMGQVSGATPSYGNYTDLIGGTGISQTGKATSRVWGTDSVGTAQPSTLWYLAEGCTNGGFETWLLVQNPDTVAANISITYMTPDGPIPGPSTKIPGSSRMTFNVGDAVPNAWSVSAKVESDRGVIAERSMYGGNRKWGTDSIGATAAQKAWFLAEGSTGGSFETWVLVQNPSSTAANVKLTYMTPNGRGDGPVAQLPPLSRQTFNVADKVPNQWSVSTRVDSDQPVVAERATYGNNRTIATESIGTPALAQSWYLAEGCTNGGFETWVLVQNPGDTKAHVKLTYMTPQGQSPGPEADLPPGSRQTFNVADMMPNQWSVSTKVDADQPVVAERSEYWSNRLEGHDSIGVSSPSYYWYLAEGCTASGFETWVLVQNPGDVDANITITYMTPKGPITGPIDVVPAHSRKTYNVADTVQGEWSVSTMVTADNPVIAERAVYGNSR